MVAAGAIAPDHSTSSEDSERSSRFGCGQLDDVAWEQLLAAAAPPLTGVGVGRFADSPDALRKAVTSERRICTCPVTAMVTPVPLMELVSSGFNPPMG